jgi:DNA repair protein SbcD/Mre11
MRILHTADWHLGDRLGRIDRTDDLRRAIERIAGYCESEKVDVLLIAGDIFSELTRPDGLRDAIRHLQETFGPFLTSGGTMIAITGNHDNENFCQTLWHVMSLASPASSDSPAAHGRLHLATGPTLMRLADRREGFDVQFVLMPYPTPSRYLDTEPAAKYSSLQEKNRSLVNAFRHKLDAMLVDPRFRTSQPSILAAHLTVIGGELPLLFRLSPEEDLAIPVGELPTAFTYVALGHIHKPQFLGGKNHVRYSGSIDRLDLGEQSDAKSITIVDIGPKGLRGEPSVRPLDATAIYEVPVANPSSELATLAERFPNAERDLVNLKIRYTAGLDSLEEVLAALQRVFPRWYNREWQETGDLGPTLIPGADERAKSFEDTVRDYLSAELTNHDDAERDAILQQAERLLGEMG